MIDEKAVNPLLTPLKIPGRVLPLPSAGLFYKSGELSPETVNGEIQVFPMSGLAEMKFRSPDLLYSGKAVTEVIKECVPSIIKPEKIISKDVDSILAFIRLVTYGPEIEIKATHNCEKAKEHSYQVNIEKIINESVQLTKEKYELFFNITLNNGQICQLTPLTWDDAVVIMQVSTMTDVDNEDVKRLYATNITGMIQSIDGVVDREMIYEWSKLAPAPLTKQIQNSVNNGLSEWGTNFETEIICKDCGNKFKVPIDLNPSSFFSL